MNINKYMIVFVSLYSLFFFSYAISENDPTFIEIKDKVDTIGSVQIIVELNVSDELEKIRDGNEINGVIIDNKSLSVQDNKQVIDEFVSDLDNFDGNQIETGTFLPYVVLEVDSTNIDDLIGIESIKSVQEDMLLNNQLTQSLSQIGADIAHSLNYTGEGQSVVVIDTGIDTDHPMFTGKVVEEACYSLNMCQFGDGSTGAGASEACFPGFEPGCDHGTHVAGIAVGNNGSGLLGVAPNATLISINVFSDTGAAEVQAYTSDIISGLERAYNLSFSYNISSITMSLGGGGYTSSCDGLSTSMTTVVENLRTVGVPTIVASGNDGAINNISFPSCISAAFAVGSVDDDGDVSSFSNSDELVDFLAPGGSIFSSVTGGGYGLKGGTSMATPHISGAWAVLKSRDPTLSINDIADALTITGIYTTDNKNLITKPLLDLSGANSFVATSNFTGGIEMLNISVNERIYEEVTYNPLSIGGGFYFDTGETQSSYTANGTITITNMNNTLSVQNVRLDFQDTSLIYNVTRVSGRDGYVESLSYNFLSLQIPDLGPSDSIVFSYQINTTTLAPPINFTTSYDKTRMLAGDTLTMIDVIQNNYDVCIYNINITQYVIDYNESGVISEFSYDNTSMAGTDSANAIVCPGNKAVYWNPLGNACLNSGSTTNISYTMFTPSSLSQSQNYEIANSTMSFMFNSTFSQLSFFRAQAAVDLDLNFDKELIDILNNTDGTWEVESEVINPSPVGINLKKVSLWVSDRNGSGTGFTNPARLERDSVSSELLVENYYPQATLTSDTYNTSTSPWWFNFSFLSAPIVWMDIEHEIVDNDVQIQDFNLSIGESFYYTKEMYIVTGYYLETLRNITRISDNVYTVRIDVRNRGNAQTPVDQVVIVYNFIDEAFSLNSSFSYSSSPWYTTDNTSETLFDTIYSGEMHQYALLPATVFNTSLAEYNGSYNVNNSWSVTYNVTGSGQFRYSDLFLTGVDPLQVEGAGASTRIEVDSFYNLDSTNAIATLLSISSLMALFISVIF